MGKERWIGLIVLTRDPKVLIAQLSRAMTLKLIAALGSTLADESAVEFELKNQRQQPHQTERVHDAIGQKSRPAFAYRTAKNPSQIRTLRLRVHKQISKK